MDRAIKRVTLAILVMFLLLMINTNYLQAFEANSLTTKPENDRAAAAQNLIERGAITTADGVTIAEDKAAPSGSQFKYQRYYPNGQVYEPVTGYDSLFSNTGIEDSEADLLSGSGQQLALRNFLDMITNKAQKGATVQTTINSKAQQAAYQGLASVLQGTGHSGGLVALDPSTGKILAMASYPSFDTNEMAVPSGDELNRTDKSLQTQSPSPLINYATDSALAPGSTFKIITSSTWFSQDSSRNPQSQVQSPPTTTLPQTTSTLSNDNGETCSPTGNNQAPILFAFAESCNTTFGLLGAGIGGTSLQSMASKYGLGNSGLKVPGATVFPGNYSVPPSVPLTAYSAIGQYNDSASPLNEAMLSAAVANNGTLMKPYLVQQVQSSDLSTISSTVPSVFSTPVSPTIASYLQQMMRAVMQDPEGTGNAYNPSNEGGLVIAGKTGTAQTVAGQEPNSVFTGYAPAGSGQTPKIAVGIMLEHGGYGSAAAVPIAVNVMKAYLSAVGQG